MTMREGDAIDSLVNSSVCPACSKPKKKRQSFCYRCYSSLPRAMKQDLYRHVTDGYVDAFNAALQHLGPDRRESEPEAAS